VLARRVSGLSRAHTPRKCRSEPARKAGARTQSKTQSLNKLARCGERTHQSQQQVDARRCVRVLATTRGIGPTAHHAHAVPKAEPASVTQHTHAASFHHDLHDATFGQTESDSVAPAGVYSAGRVIEMSHVPYHKGRSKDVHVR
jgi:hypothetical protein